MFPPSFPVPAQSNTGCPNVQSHIAPYRYCTRSRCSKAFRRTERSWWNSSRCSIQPGIADGTWPGADGVKRKFPSKLNVFFWMEIFYAKSKVQLLKYNFQRDLTILWESSIRYLSDIV